MMDIYNEADDNCVYIALMDLMITMYVYVTGFWKTD